MRVVTWNVLGAEAGVHQCRLLAERLRGLAPDVVCLQEARRPLVRSVARSTGLQTTRFVAKQREWRLPWWQEGLATLVRAPAARAAGHDLHAGRRVAVESVHEVGSTRLHVINAHLHTDTEGRARNVEVVAQLCARIRTTGGVPVVAGDLNTKPRPPEHPDTAYEQLLAGAGLVDAFARLHAESADPERCPGVAGTDPGVEEALRCGYTNWHDAREPAQRRGAPQQRLDYVLVADDPRVVVQHASTPGPGDDDFDVFRPVSDHLPVIADLRVVADALAREDEPTTL